MKLIFKPFFIFLLFTFFSCKESSQQKEVTETEQKIIVETPFVWKASNVYFLLTDRFNNGDASNDVTLERTKETGKLRGFEGGDIKGIIQKIEEGYFSDLGINAIWFTPVVEQIHDSVDEGTGNTYAFHGYWAKDWTQIDPNFGTYNDLKKLVNVAHQKGIRILMDVVINHTGPVTEKDPKWDDNWVRTGPQCSYKDYQTAVSCTLVENLPDTKTESNEEVDLPKPLIQKWTQEGRLEKELAELDAFFAKTGLSKSPKNYIIKWLTDYVRDLGIDGFRVDTVKHVEESVWKTLEEQAQLAFAEWKKNFPDKVLDDNDFYILGELYGYGIDGKRFYDFGDRKVDYFANGFDNLINFQFKYDALKDYETIFSKYNKILQNDLNDKSVMNYISSHDDGQPFDKNRTKTFEAATKLMLTSGISQVYYGDETARSLVIEGTEGDATLRSKMNWDSIARPETKKLLLHWQKLGKFRKDHPAVGAGVHQLISKKPYTFSRTYSDENYTDKVVIGLSLPSTTKTIATGTVFEDNTKLIDKYSGKEVTVSNGQVTLNSEFDIVLLEEKK